MKKLIIEGTDKYIDYLDKSLNEQYPETKHKKIIKKINENLLKGEDFDIELE